ncbi:MAG: hypothetical protein ACU836_02820 [Gammaproteobacteria bacterium]
MAILSSSEILLGQLRFEMNQPFNLEKGMSDLSPVFASDQALYQKLHANLAEVMSGHWLYRRVVAPGRFHPQGYHTRPMLDCLESLPQRQKLCT